MMLILEKPGLAKKIKEGFVLYFYLKTTLITRDTVSFYIPTFFTENFPCF